MELRQLEHFVAIARAGALARAAETLGISQPSLTRSVAALEQALAVRLFDRGNRGTVLNEAGQRLLPRAIAILREAERARGEFRPTAGTEPADEVRLGVSPNMLFTRLPRLLRELAGAADGPRVQVATGTHERLCKGLRQCELDVVVCVSTGFPLDLAAEDLTHGLLGHERVVPVAAAGHPVLDGEVSLAAAGAHRWAVPLHMSLLYRFEYAFYRHGLPPPVQAITSTSLSLLLDAVRDGGLLGMLPRSMLEDARRCDGVAALGIAELAFDYDVNVIVNAQAPLALGARRLVDAMLGGRNGAGATMGVGAPALSPGNGAAASPARPRPRRRRRG